MKHLIFIALTLTILQTVSGQTIPEPEFSARPYYLTEEGVLKNLERAEATTDVKVKGMGYGGADYFYTAFGLRSSTRFNNNHLPRLFIKIDGDADPSDVLSVLKAEIPKRNKDRRRFKQGGMKLGGKARDVSNNKVHFEINKIRDNIYEIIFPNGLELGEYAFMPLTASNVNILSMSSNSMKISCFGVD